MKSKFIQIHFLTSFAGCLLNRDDVGQAKRMPFGGTSRLRISSQCLKHHWRKDGASPYSLQLLGAPASLRSRHIFDYAIAQPLTATFGKDLAQSVAQALANWVIDGKTKSQSKTEKKKKGQSEEGEEKEELDKDSKKKEKQILVLGKPEIAYLRDIAQAVCAEVQQQPESCGKIIEKHLEKQAKNLEALKKAGMGLDAALFGRMVTSDILARGDAAIHVAHAFTVHAEEAEVDYFTAIDDLVAAGKVPNESGAGHINHSELTSGLFYGYVVVDTSLLIKNLSNDRDLAGKVVANLLGQIAVISPGAKKGSTAPYSYAQFLLVESGDAQPCSLANAFLKPIKLNASNVLENSVTAIGKYLNEFDGIYATGNTRKFCGMNLPSNLLDVSGLEKSASLELLRQWVATEINRGE